MKFLDSTTIDELINLGGDDGDNAFVQDLIATYFDVAPSTLTNLKVALSKNAVKDIEHFSHKLKGLSLNLGIKPLAELCGEVEARCKKIRPQEVSALSQKLTELYEGAANELRGIVKKAA